MNSLCGNFLIPSRRFRAKDHVCVVCFRICYFPGFIAGYLKATSPILCSYRFTGPTEGTLLFWIRIANVKGFRHCRICNYNIWYVFSVSDIRHSLMLRNKRHVTFKLLGNYATPGLVVLQLHNIPTSGIEGIRWIRKNVRGKNCYFHPSSLAGLDDSSHFEDFH